MNRIFVTTLKIGIVAFLGLSILPAEAALMRKNVYTATCALTHPLYAQDRCEEGSYWGRQATYCAADQAMDECRGENNVDCMHVSVRVWAESSQEFIGYKKCVARARVHGYEVIY